MRAGSNNPTGSDVVSNATPIGKADDDPLLLDLTKIRAPMLVVDSVADLGKRR